MTGASDDLHRRLPSNWDRGLQFVAPIMLIQNLGLRNRLLTFQIEVQELSNDAVKQISTHGVKPAGHIIHMNAVVGLLKGISEPSCLGHRYHRVIGSLNDQRGRLGSVDVCQRIGCRGRRQNLFGISYYTCRKVNNSAVQARNKESGCFYI